MVVAMENVCPTSMSANLSLEKGLCPAVQRILAVMGEPISVPHSQSFISVYLSRMNSESKSELSYLEGFAEDKSYVVIYTTHIKKNEILFWQ
jgi:hypothetical protein